MPGIVAFHCPQELEEKVAHGPNAFVGSDPPSDSINWISEPKTIPAAEPRPCNE